MNGVYTFPSAMYWYRDKNTDERFSQSLTVQKVEQQSALELKYEATEGKHPLKIYHVRKDENFTEVMQFEDDINGRSSSVFTG